MKQIRWWMTAGLCLSLAACGTTAPTGDASDVTGSDATQDSVGNVDVITPNDVASDQSSPPDVPAADVATRMRVHSSFVPTAQRPTAATRLIVMGDSISAGTGASAPAQTYFNLLANNDDTAHPSDANTDLSTFFNAPVPVVSVAVGGATTTTMANNQIPSLRMRLPPPVMGHSVVVITIGGNDLQSAIITNDPPDGPLLTAAINNLRTTVTYLRDPANFPDGTSIYIANVYDPSDGLGQIRMMDGARRTCFFGLALPEFVVALDVWDRRYRQLGMELGFAIIDGLGRFHGHGHNCERMENPYYLASDTSYWFADCIHPNDRGHHELRRLFFEAINPAYRIE